MTIIRLGGVLNVGVRYEILLGRKVDTRRTTFEQGLEPKLDAGWHARQKRRAPKLENKNDGLGEHDFIRLVSNQENAVPRSGFALASRTTP